MNMQTSTAGLDADDRQQLVDSVRRFAERDYGFEARMRALRQDGGFSPRITAQGQTELFSARDRKSVV